MGRKRRGGFIFDFWIGDHPPRHVHVFKDSKFIAKIELDKELTCMEGKTSRKLLKVLKSLIQEGLLK